MKGGKGRDSRIICGVLECSVYLSVWIFSQKITFLNFKEIFEKLIDH